MREALNVNWIIFVHLQKMSSFLNIFIHIIQYTLNTVNVYYATVLHGDKSP